MSASRIRFHGGSTVLLLYTVLYVEELSGIVQGSPKETSLATTACEVGINIL